MNGGRTFRRPAEGRGEEGSTAVEVGVTISVLLSLIVGSVEFGRAFWTYNTMLLAVEEAGRYAMIYPNSGAPETCGAQSQASNCPALSNTSRANCSAARAQQVLSTYQAPRMGVSVNENTTSLTICTSYSFEFLAPQILPYGPLNLTSRVTVPLI
jgi:Flp pilus assembly protein TadG